LPDPARLPACELHYESPSEQEYINNMAEFNPQGRQATAADITARNKEQLINKMPCVDCGEIIQDRDATRDLRDRGRVLCYKHGYLWNKYQHHNWFKESNKTREERKVIVRADRTKKVANGSNFWTPKAPNQFVKTHPDYGKAPTK